MHACKAVENNLAINPEYTIRGASLKLWKKMTFERKKHSMYNFFFYTRSRFDLKKIDTGNKNINMNINLRFFLSKESFINLLIDLDKNINLLEEFKTNF